MRVLPLPDHTTTLPIPPLPPPHTPYHDHIAAAIQLPVLPLYYCVNTAVTSVVFMGQAR